MAKVVVKEGESIDQALKRFRKDLEKTGVLRDARKHEHYEKPSDRKRRIKARRARRGR
jgi:small subunit ribosomal protein S21